MKKGRRNKELSSKQRKELFKTLKQRFEKNMKRHQELKWTAVKSRLESNNQKLWSLSEMERTGGEPDVVDYDQANDEFIFYDCAAESPEGRRKICYDREALEKRKKNKPENNAADLAAEMGIKILTEKQYRKLQELEEFDLKTSSWVKTPVEVRELGGALFCDRRYNKVFVYHNGAQSYYSSRGFRGFLRV